MRARTRPPVSDAASQHLSQGPSRANESAESWTASVFPQRPGPGGRVENGSLNVPWRDQAHPPSGPFYTRSLRLRTQDPPSKWALSLRVAGLDASVRPVLCGKDISQGVSSSRIPHLRSNRTQVAGESEVSVVLFCAVAPGCVPQTLAWRGLCAQNPPRRFTWPDWSKKVLTSLVACLILACSLAKEAVAPLQKSVGAVKCVLSRDASRQRGVLRLLPLFYEERLR